MSAVNVKLSCSNNEGRPPSIDFAEARRHYLSLTGESCISAEAELEFKKVEAAFRQDSALVLRAFGSTQRLAEVVAERLEDRECANPLGDSTTGGHKGAGALIEEQEAKFNGRFRKKV